ncbi:MAG: hypothetical protein ACSHW0_09790 [Thalassotalea sp.]
MLVVSGVAESMRTDNKIVKGQTYGFSLFCQNEILDEQLETIENYMIGKGLDNIVIKEQEFIDSENDLAHEVLVDAFQAAITEGISGVINKTPLAA